ncbi:hypothetical protein PIB30_069070 [Stylosanthes scabra]|uniref:Uncharacterized protein n=1 Tax=Stylosanthes scabra TaxID=79078 RepID=A0ABU6VNA2_9FABA|nr:hypothetical protein [Stylosanthes scabra]
MASSSSTVSVFDAHRFRKAHNEQLFYSYARRRKVILEVGFNLEEDEYPEIMEQIALRGWRRLAAPRTDISKLLVQEFYANAAVSDEEAVVQEELPYKSFIRGKEVDFSPNNIRRVMRFKRETAGAQTDYKTRQALNQRLDEDRITATSKGLARVYYSLTCANGEQIGSHNIKGHLNSHHHARGRCNGGRNHSRQHGNNSSRIGKQGNLVHPITIYKLCKDAGVPSREFIRTPRIPALSYITAKRMEIIWFLRNQPQQQQEDEEEDEPIPQADGGNFEEEDQQPPQQDQQPQQHGFPNFQPRYESQYHADLQGIEETLSSMQFFQQTFYENMQKSQADYMEEVKQIKEKQEQIYNHNQRFHSQIWQEQEKLAKEIQEVRRSQLAQAVANNQRLEVERNIQLALESQGRDIVEIRKQVNLWTNNVSSKEAYACWAQQQGNPNLSEIPITQILDIMRTNVERGRPLFHGFLKSDYGASSSQVDPEEPVPLWTAPPSPHFRPPHPPPI